MTADAVAQGIVLGLVYGALGVGLVLVFRTSRVVNFAHGEIGALGAAGLAKLVLDEHWPWVVAAAVVLALGAAIGALTELLIARRVAHRPKLVLLVATIGLSQLLLVAQLLLPSIREVAPYPSPMHRRVTIGSIVLTGRDFVPLAIIPALIVGLTVWLTSTPSGRALRAVGEDRRGAELCGVRTGRVAVVAWALAGALSTATAVLANPLQGVIVGRPSEALGAGLMVRALAAAMVGRLRSVPMAMFGGVAVGLIQAVANNGHFDPSVADIALLVFMLGVVLIGARGGDDSEEGQLAVVPPLRQVSPVFVLGALAVAASAPVFARPSELFSLSRVVLYALVGLSLVLLTGWGGQLSLGQFAIAGVGTFALALLERHGVPFWVSLPCVIVIGAVVSLVVGLPALRVRGLELAVTTLAFAVACSSWLFTRSGLLDAQGTATVHRSLLTGPLAFYEVCLGALAAGLVVAVSVRRSDLGRRMLAVRSDERRAAALGISPARTKLAAFAVAGGMAALAGALLGVLRVHSSAADFGPAESLRIVAVVVIGGAGSVAGAVVGTIVVLGVPAMFGSTTIAGLLPSGIGILVLTLLFPGGLVSLWRRAPLRGEPVRRPMRPLARPPAGVELRDVRVRFGGRVALDGVDLVIEPGSAVGLIGANGAGKTTLLDVISGFTLCDGGVFVAGRPMGRMSPAARARLGIGRVVQGTRVFEDLTVAEVVISAAALSRFGLDEYASMPCQELPTGIRRVVDLASVAAMRPRILLLDEPTSGLSHAEVETLLPVIQELANQTTLVLVEHDVSFVREVVDRIVVLDLGRVRTEQIR
jgi:branched-subunit amino acid ABC-type transport system permease component/ABC-type branched-subunit amino acid transport system ATPase component